MILVAGGTGRLGRLVVRRLADRGLPVSVLTRDPARAAGLPAAVVVGDVRRPLAFGQVDVVVSAVHGFAGPGGVTPETVDRDGNAHLVDAAKEAGADVIMLSVQGAAPDHPMLLHRMKYAAEEHLRASGMRWTVVRATAFRELWVELLGRSRRPLVFGGGDNPINFVGVDEVAALVERAVVDPGLRGQVLEAGGQNLTFNELAATVRPETPRHVPPLALKVLARVGPRGLARQARAALAMDTIDLTWSPPG
ncbi:SDR family oxidoreductase [Lentzea kentuckyensis]|uniref:SDR family oxidoreductase n=1 Tax=Lentzea kentuckyensis TaxID=360086 RepID=UPI00130285C3|nr:SDR family oxidoreductase [Lentzea kentuckyensis]